MRINKTQLLLFLILLAGCGGNKDEEARKQYQVGEEFYRVGIYEVAIKEYERVIENYPKSKWRESASKRIEECKIAFEVKEEFDKLFKLKEKGDYSEAKERFLRFIKKYPETELAKEAIYQVGLCYEEEKDFDKAIGYFREVADTNPYARAELESLKRDEENFQKGLVLIKQKRYYEAQRVLSWVKKKNLDETKKISDNIRNILENKRSISFQKRPLETHPSSNKSSEGYNIFHFAREMQAQGSSINHLLARMGMMITQNEVVKTKDSYLIFSWKDNYKEKVDYLLRIQAVGDKDEIKDKWDIEIFIPGKRFCSFLESKLKEGDYYWKVDASNGGYSDIGFFSVGTTFDEKGAKAHSKMVTKAYSRKEEISAIESLIATFEDGDDSTRMIAAQALGSTKDPRAVKPLIAGLEDKNPFVRMSSAEALGKMKDNHATEPLIAAFEKDKNKDVRIIIARTLGNIEDPRTVKPLIVALKDEDEDIRAIAAGALGKIKKLSAVEPLIVALKDEDSYVRMNAAEALGNIGDYRSVEPLIAALKDEDSCVLIEVEEALRCITGKDFGRSREKWQKWWEQDRWK